MTTDKTRPDRRHARPCVVEVTSTVFARVAGGLVQHYPSGVNAPVVEALDVWELSPALGFGTFMDGVSRTLLEPSGVGPLIFNIHRVAKSPRGCLSARLAFVEKGLYELGAVIGSLQTQDDAS